MSFHLGNSFACRVTKKPFLSLVLPLLFTACDAVGPDFVKPDAPVSEQWIEGRDEAIRTTDVPIDEWWTLFNDPVLNRLIAKSHEENLPLQIAGIRILEARAQLGIAIGNQYPQSQQIRGGITQFQLSDNQANLPAFADTSFAAANIGLDVGWELDMWGKFRRGIEAADADLLASIADYDDVLVSLTGSVATAYILVRTFQERLRIARDNVKIQQRSLDITRVRFENGATTELDVQQARTLLFDTQSTIPSLEIGLRQSKNALSTLLGMPPGNLDDLLGDHEVIPSAPAEVAVGIPAELLRRRPDIRRAELLAAAQSARIGIARAALYPQFSLVGSIGLSSSNAFNSDLGDMFQLNSIEAFAGPSLTWDVFNYGRLKNNVRAQDARLQQLIVNYQNTVLEASREVENALTGFLRAQERVIFLEQSVEAAQRSVDIALLQYRDGVSDYLGVLITQGELIRTQDLLTQSRGDIATNLVDMYRALGGGWQLRKDKEIVPSETREEMIQRTDWGTLMDDLPTAAPQTTDQ